MAAEILDVHGATAPNGFKLGWEPVAALLLLLLATTTTLKRGDIRPSRCWCPQDQYSPCEKFEALSARSNTEKRARARARVNLLNALGACLLPRGVHR